MIDLRSDAHVHTAFSSGRDSVSVLVGAAERVGLHAVTFADRAGPESGWLSSYLASIHRAQGRTEVTLRPGVEVEAIGADGWMAFPPDLGGLEVIAVGLDRLPLPSGPVGPEAVRSLIASGSITQREVVERFVEVTCRALERVARYAPATLARPLAFLERAGIPHRELGGAVVTQLAAACRAHQTSVEVSERHRLPSPELARDLLAEGVRLAPASEASVAEEVGRWEYVDQVARVLSSDGSP